MNRSALKHTVAFVVCAAAVLVVGYWGMAMSLATFAPGGDVTFSEAQKRRAARGATFERSGDCLQV